MKPLSCLFVLAMLFACVLAQDDAANGSSQEDSFDDPALDALPLDDSGDVNGVGANGPGQGNSGGGGNSSPVQGGGNAGSGGSESPIGGGSGPPSQGGSGSPSEGNSFTKYFVTCDTGLRNFPLNFHSAVCWNCKGNRLCFKDYSGNKCVICGGKRRCLSQSNISNKGCFQCNSKRICYGSA